MEYTANKELTDTEILQATFYDDLMTVDVGEPETEAGIQTVTIDGKRAGAFWELGPALDGFGVEIFGDEKIRRLSGRITAADVVGFIVKKHWLGKYYD